jgi:hypothetical protein
MKNRILILSLATITTVFMACNKEGMLDSDLNIDLDGYEATLNSDYSDALKNHNAINSNPAHYKMMFNTNDSLFSEHFYDFCIDMMKNSGMMSTTGGMMGNFSSMMGGSGGMMNGTVMGSNSDMVKMMEYMDSIHVSAYSIIPPDYFGTDSLMYNQMTLCKMMIPQTEGITSVFINMQLLRKKHHELHY